MRDQKINSLKLKPPSLIRADGYYLFSGSFDSNLICAFSTRALENMSLVYGDTEDSLDNRSEFLRKLGIDYHDLVCAKQVHGTGIQYIKEADKGKGSLSYDTAIAETDALITDRRNLPLAVFTADCLSIFLHDPTTVSIGLVHAGWRSSKEKIVTETVQLMRERFNTKAEDLYVGFGSAIRGCCYEVGQKFNDHFPDDIIKKNGCNYLDLAKINKKELLDQGVKDVNIFDSNICTACQNNEFFSFRREGAGCGRMMSVMMLKRPS